MSKNVLEMIPIVKDHITLKQAENATCFVFIPRIGWLERISIRFLKQPDHHTIHLDQLGSFVIQLCDGKNCVQDLEQKIMRTFGQKATPIRDRLLAFLSIIEMNGWIEWREP
jgi:hypothetical protein